MNGHRPGLYASLALVLGAGALLLAGAAWNRDAVDTRIELTERECSLKTGNNDDNTEVTLRFVWREPDVDVPDAAPWLDSTGLRAVGFDVTPPPPDQSPAYERLLPREAFLVLEMEGPAWRWWIDARQREAAQRITETKDAAARKLYEDALDSDRHKGSRLVAVAAGRDPRALRERFPDRSRYLILPAEITMSNLPFNQKYILHGTAALRSEQIPVPLSFRRALAAPHYRVTIAVGRRFEPWLDKVEPCAE
jgi:hypothetical protein